MCWGANDAGQLEAPAGVAFEHVACGGAYCCARRLGEGAPTVGRYPNYPLEGPSVLCWGAEPSAAAPAAAASAARPAWLHWLPRAAQRHQQ